MPMVRQPDRKTVWNARNARLRPVQASSTIHCQGHIACLPLDSRPQTLGAAKQPPGVWGDGIVAADLGVQSVLPADRNRERVKPAFHLIADRQEGLYARPRVQARS